MSENNEAQQVEVVEPSEAVETTQPSLEELLAAAKADAEKWKSLSRQNEKRNGENFKRVSELEAENAELKNRLPEVEKLQAELSEASISAAKEKVGRQYGLSDVFVNALTGTSLEEIEHSAKAFASELEGKKTVSTPVVDVTQGVSAQDGAKDAWVEALGMGS